MPKWVVPMATMLAFGAPESLGKEAGTMPVVHQTLEPAARARIGQRGLYVTSLVRLSNGDLLACPHYGSTALQRVSIWRSSDEGLTWTEVRTRGDALFGAGALLKCLKDGTVLLHTGALYRSTDDGVTWRHVACDETGVTRGIIEQPDGGLLMFGAEPSWYLGYEPPPASLQGVSSAWYRETSYGSRAIRRAWRLRSQDGGETWPEREAVVDENKEATNRRGQGWDAPQPFFKEACVVALSDTRLLAATRFTKAGERIVLMESDDNGLHWTEPRVFLAPGEIHAHLLVLGDGRLLCTYARHGLPRGIFAVVSDDRGKTWDTDHPVHLAISRADLFGWPTSIRMPDGTILTSYTIKAYEETTQVNDSATEVVRWQLPGAEGVGIEPASKPVFAEKHEYRKYPGGITGFTGRGLQQVAYCETSPAQRAYLPGYKGAVSRFPNGELLACPAQGANSVIHRSTDEGASWQKVKTKGDQTPGKEQAMLCLQDGKTVLLQTAAPGRPLFRSADAGLTWSAPRWMNLGYSAVHVHFLKLTDGRILCAYRRRFLPFGLGAVLSEDNGKTWDMNHPIVLGMYSTCYGGWPTSVQFEDGTILTTWASNGFHSIRWRAPPPSDGPQNK